MAKQRKVTPKTQREISESLQDPLTPGGPGFVPTGNPNDANTVNRALQTSFKDDTVKPFSVGLEDLDWAVMYYFKMLLNQPLNKMENYYLFP